MSVPVRPGNQVCWPPKSITPTVTSVPCPTGPEPSPGRCTRARQRAQLPDGLQKDGLRTSDNGWRDPKGLVPLFGALHFRQLEAQLAHLTLLTSILIIKRGMGIQLPLWPHSLIVTSSPQAPCTALARTLAISPGQAG